MAVRAMVYARAMSVDALRDDNRRDPLERKGKADGGLPIIDA
jgi:hypothetical protein